MIRSDNEWGRLEKVILGSTKNFNFSTTDEKYIRIPNRPSGPANFEKILETEEALASWQKLLEDMGVDVLRPSEIDYQKLDGFGSYCPRDTVLVIGNKVILTPTVWKKRTIEWHALKDYLGSDYVLPTDQNVMFDAANIIRCNRDILYLISYSGNEAGADWLQSYLGPEYTVHKLKNVYNGMHLDSTILPLREGLVMLNSTRINESKLPKFMMSWDKIWITEDDMWKDPELNSMTSNWIGINILSYDENAVFCDPKQIKLMKKLSKYGIESIGINIPNTKYFMGGHHCASLDLKRNS